MTNAEAGDRKDDLQAAEYVLGVLPQNERAAFARRIASDRKLAGRVRFWEHHFSAFNAAIKPVPPPRSTGRAVEAQLFGEVAASGGLWQNLAFWRAAAVSLLVALVALTGLYVSSITQRQSASHVAELSSENRTVTLLAVYDQGRGVLKFNRLSGTPASGRSFELWLIAGGNAPVSLGLLPENPVAEIVVAAALRQSLGSAVLAVSDEPAGGSPTGQPTGAVLASGELRPI